MDESEKRRERLQALRTEAASQASTPSPSPHASSATLPPAHLSNPGGLDTAGTTPPQPPRFDFYTDPMSAYSASKRRTGGGCGAYGPLESFASPIRSPSPSFRPCTNQYSAGPRNYHMVTPAHQFQVKQSPDQSPYGMPLHVPQYGQWRSPVPLASPLSVGPGANPASSPSVSNRSGYSSGHGFSPSSSRGGHMSPSFGRGGSPMNSSGRGSPHSYSGRAGWSGGRVPHFGNKDTGQSHIKSMMEDPWHDLKPIVGSILVPLAGPGHWIPKSLTVKKPKIEESGDKVNTQWSLAESLAASFEAAIDEENA